MDTFSAAFTCVKTLKDCKAALGAPSVFLPRVCSAVNECCYLIDVQLAFLLLVAS